MPRLSKVALDDIARNCLELYAKLPKNGKSVENEEWTVMSCVVQTGPNGTRAQPVTLGLGSKCIGAGQLVSNGTRLHDSHAEVCARRAFLLYLYDHISLCLINKPSIFERDSGRFRLKADIEFVFYSSQLPCGDASILPFLPKVDEEQDYGDLLQSRKRPVSENILCMESQSKKAKVEGDIHRTGAKCLPGAEDDPRGEGASYHRLGAVRTKPGRGERTLSVSCSDKMARWAHIGIQGALLHMLCGPIYIKHFIFGGGVPYSEQSLKRALVTRGGESILIECVPEFYQTSLVFPHVRTQTNMRPAPGSIIWVQNIGTPEVAVQGRKLGLTKKSATSPKHALCITKYKLYERFIDILQKDKFIAESILGNTSAANINIPYNEMKRKSSQYIKRWSDVKDKFFGSWTVKPDMWNFCIERATEAEPELSESQSHT